MPDIRTGPRIVVSVTATESGDWQVVSTPTGFQGITTAAGFADNEYLHGFVRFENGEDWEEYDTDDETSTNLLQISNITGTVTISRPATPYKSSNSGDRVNAGAGTHTLAISLGSGTMARILREINGEWKTLTSGDATPDVSRYRLFKTAGTTTITAFDSMEAGKLFIVRRGASDITIADGAGISLPGDENITLTAAQPSAVFVEDNGVAYLVATTGTAVLDEDDFASNSATRPPSQQSVAAYVAKIPDGGTIAADGNNEITVAPRRRYTLTASDTIAGIIGLADGEFAQLIAPVSGSTTLQDEGTATSGQSLKLSGADLAIQSTDETVYTITRAGANIRVSGGSAESGIETVATLQALTGLSTSGLTNGDLRNVIEAKRGGIFEWNSSDLSTQVGYETTTANNYVRAGVYYAPDTTNGSAGAWVRKDWLNGIPAQPEWFGAASDGVGNTDDAPAFQAAIDFFDAQISEGAFTSGGGATLQLRPLGDYYIATQVNVPDSLDGFGMVGLPGKFGPRIVTDQSALVMFMVATDLSGGADTSGADEVYGFTARNVTFQNTTLTSTACVALQFNKSPWAQIVDCLFVGFNNAILGHRFNGDVIRGCRFHAGARVAANAAEAFIKFNGVFDSTDGNTPGGSVKLSQCEFIGNPTDGAAMESCVKISAADTLYFTDCHFNHTKDHVLIAPEDNAYNHRLVDIMFTKCYFDASGAAGSTGVRFEGTLDNNANTLSENFTFNQCYFRQTTYGVFFSITDGGAYAGGLKNLKFNGCYFRKYGAQAIYIEGDNSSKIAPDNVSVVGCFFGDGNVDTGATSAISSEAQSTLIHDCDFAAEDEAPTRVIDIVITNTNTNQQVASIKNNNFASANYTGDWPWRITAGNAKNLFIEGNILPVTAESENQVYTGQTEDDAALVLWYRDFAANNINGRIEADVVGVSFSPPSANKRISAKVTASIHRDDAALITIYEGEGVAASLDENVTNTAAPVAFIDLFGATTRADTTAYSLADTILVSGQIWMCIVAGTSAGTAPTFTGNSVVDGTVRWVSVAAQDTNRVALVVTGGGTADIKWAAKVNYISVSD